MVVEEKYWKEKEQEEAEGENELEKEVYDEEVQVEE